MEFRILGPLEVRHQRGPVPLGGTKPRAVLAVLLLHANAPVSAERLAQALWGDDAPARAVKTVQVHVSRLRKALGDESAIDTSAAGYRLRVEPGELDAEQFERLAEEGRRALAAGDAEAAADALRAALELWRGPALADLAGEPFAQAEIARLEEHRLTAVETRVEADLALGREAELIGELQRLAAAYPTRERLAGQLMLALYRCGRQADALEAYREARSRLVAEIGVEPGPDLRRLQDAILHQDQALLGERPAELPRELERAMALPLEGRTAELAWLQERWRDVRAGTGAVVTLRGEAGIGKSRLAAEFAAAAHAHGASVLYADASGAPAAALDAIARARETPRPTVLVVDDAGGAPAAVREELAAFGRGVSDVPVLAVVLDAEGNRGADGDALLLAPLDGDAVHAIVTRYVPQDLPDPPDEWLLGASRGVPRLVHELAGQWARREAARRVETGAERTAARRADLRAMERELAADVVVLEAARGHEPPEAGNGALVCPFKGLASFQVADAPYFFGRERLVAELVARLVGAPLLGIVGPSGSGKSSVLRAGLLPALAAGVLPGSEHAHQILIRPGAHPLSELRTALARVPDGPVVLAVDQFEETFTLCEDEHERAGFMAELARLARGHDGGGAIALAMRADFYGRCAEFPELSRLLAANHVLVGGMRADDLRRAVECPAQRAGLIVDPDLVDALVDDVEGEPGALPLLSTALLELWQQRDGRRLRHVAYERAGGVRGAVARLGEDAYARLDAPQRVIARRVLQRLASIDDGGGVERLRVAPAELGGPDTTEVVGLLADSRLLTVHAGTVELAHEALLREWPRLRGWISEDQESLRVHRGLSSGAREWERLDRDDGALLRGARLAEAREWIEPESLAGYEREYLSASVERAERERRGRRRRVEIAIGALAAGVVAIGIVALVAINQRHDAERQRNLALSRSLAAQSQQTVADDPELALRLALWADQVTPTREATAALRQATLADRRLAAFPADRLTAETAAFSPDGARIVTGGDTGVARLWDARTRRQLAQLAFPRQKVMSARYSPDGARIALALSDGRVVVTDASLKGARAVLKAGTQVNRVAFDHGGTHLAAAVGDGTARVLALDGSAAPVTLSVGPPVFGVDLDPAGRVATADAGGGVKLWPAGGQGEPLTLPAGDASMRDVRFSPDGKLVLAVGDDGHARLWNADGTRRADVEVGPRSLTAAAFSKDGRRFATAGYDGAVRVWSTAGPAQLVVARGQIARVLDVGFGASGDRVVSAGDDGTAKIWDASGVQAFAGPTKTWNVDFSPSGRWIATGGDDGAVRLWNASTGRPGRVLDGEPGYVTARFSPVADELLIGRDPPASISRLPLSAARPELVERLPKGSELFLARFDPTGRRVIVADGNGKIAIRDVQTGRDVKLGGTPGTVYDVKLSPDGRHAAAATESGALLVWDMAHPQQRPRALTGHRGHINTVDYSRDGRIVTAGADRTARVWDPTSGRQVILRGHRDEVTTAAFTRDGSRVLTTSADGTVRLWDARRGDALVVLQDTGDVPMYDIAQGPGGKLATLDGNWVVRIYRCSVCGDDAQVRRLALSRHPRELTAAERRLYLSELG